MVMITKARVLKTNSEKVWPLLPISIIRRTSFGVRNRMPVR